MVKKLPKLISDKATLSILNKIGYMAESLYNFKVGAHNDFSLELAIKSEKKWLIIVERGHYFESVKDYPIGDAGDLRNVLKNQSGGFPYKGQVSHKIQRISESVHRVTTWVIKQEIIDRVGNSPKWLVPESACLERVSKTGVVALTLSDKVLYITETPDGLISGLGREEGFLRSAGVEREYSGVLGPGSSDKKVIPILGGDAIATILIGLVDLFKAHPLMFFLRAGKPDFVEYPWFGAVKRSAILFLSYLLITTLYLSASASWIDIKLDNQSAGSESSLSLSKDISSYKSQAIEIQNVFREQPASWVTWDVFLDLLESEINVIAVNFRPPDVTFIAMAPRATDVLAMLSSDPRVQNASFALPVRKSGDLDQFSIRVRFLQQDSGLVSNLESDVSRESMLPSVDAGAQQSE